MNKTSLVAIFLIFIVSIARSQPDYLYRDSLGAVLNIEADFITYGSSGFTKINNDGDTIFCKKTLPSSKCLNLTNGNILFYTYNSQSLTITKVDQNGNVVYRKLYNFPVNTFSGMFVFEDTSNNNCLFVSSKGLLKIDNSGNILFSKKLEVDPGNNPFQYVLTAQNISIRYAARKGNNILLLGTMPSVLSINNYGRCWAEMDMNGNILSFEVFKGGSNTLDMVDHFSYQSSFVTNAYQEMYITDNSHTVTRIFYDMTQEGYYSVLSLAKITANNYIALLVNNSPNPPVYKLRNYNFLTNTYKEIELSKIYGGRLTKSGTIGFKKVKMYDASNVLVLGDFNTTSAPYYLKLNANFVADSCFLKYPVTTHAIPSYPISTTTVSAYAYITPAVSYTSATITSITISNRYFKTRTTALPKIQTISVTPPVCFNSNNAAVTATGINGWPLNHMNNPGYSFSLYNSLGTLTGLSNLSAGNYTLFMKDSLGCRSSQTVSITNPPVLVPSHTILTNPVCFNTNFATVQFTATGGVPSYSVSALNGAPYTAFNNTMNLAPNTSYSVTMKDSRGCTKNDTLTITTRPYWAILERTKKNCINPANVGALQLIPVNSISPYAFTVNAPNTTVYPDSAKASNLPSGNYSYTVTDNVGCSINGVVNVVTADPVNLSVTSTVVCNGNDGAISLAAPFDTSYTYQWNIPNQTQKTLNNLSPGVYSYTVTEENNCRHFGSYTLDPPPVTTVVSNYTTTCNDPVQINGSSNYSMSYNWYPQTGVASPNSLNTLIYPTHSGNYTLNAYYQGCSKNYPVNIHVNYPSNFSYTTNSLSVTFSMSDMPYCTGNSFMWDFGNGMQNTVAPNPSVTYNLPGLYTACLKCGTVPQACIACTTFSLPSNAAGGTDVSVFEYKDASLGIKCYPNPNNGNFFIDSEKETSLTITTVLGEILLKQTLQPGKNEIDLSNQSNGIYFIKTEHSTFKIMKQ